MFFNLFLGKEETEKVTFFLVKKEEKDLNTPKPIILLVNHKMKTKTVRLTDQDEKMLEELSRKYNMSESELIRHLIRKEHEKLMQFYLED